MAKRERPLPRRFRGLCGMCWKPPIEDCAAWRKAGPVRRDGDHIRGATVDFTKPQPARSAACRARTALRDIQRGLADLEAALTPPRGPKIELTNVYDTLTKIVAGSGL